MRILIIKTVKDLKQKIILVAKVSILLLIVGVFAGETSAQFSSSAPVNTFFVNMFLPLNTGNSPQIKEGPLLINADNIRTEFPFIQTSFGLNIVHGSGSSVNNGGILIGDRASSTIPASDRSQLHIYKNPTNLQQPAIRVEGRGPAFVTKYFETEIGIGTLNPEYHIDIPNGNPIMRIGGGPVPSEVSLQTVGTIQILGGNPHFSPNGVYLQSQNIDGKGIWTEGLNTQIGTNPNITPPSSFYSIDQSFVNGITSHSIAISERGYWYITVFGTTGEGNSVHAANTVNVSITGSPGTLALPVGKSFLLRNPPHGTAPYSVTFVVHLINPGVLNFAVGDNNGGVYGPNMNGISGYLLGN